MRRLLYLVGDVADIRLHGRRYISPDILDTFDCLQQFVCAITSDSWVFDCASGFADAFPFPLDVSDDNVFHCRTLENDHEIQ